MAFKYLYCHKGVDKNKFKECHMPLDSFTLAWLLSNGGEFYQEWSWFKKKNYIEAQSKIKEILDEDILAKEFVIWNEYKSKHVDLKKEYLKGDTTLE